MEQLKKLLAKKLALPPLPDDNRTDAGSATGPSRIKSARFSDVRDAKMHQLGELGEFACVKTVKAREPASPLVR